MHGKRGPPAPRTPNRRPAAQSGSPSPALTSSSAVSASPASPPPAPAGSGSPFGLGSPWCGAHPDLALLARPASGAELGPASASAPLRLGVSSGEQVFVDPRNRDAVLVPTRGMQIPHGLTTTTAYTVDVQLANGLCYAVRRRLSRCEAAALRKRGCDPLFAGRPPWTIGAEGAAVCMRPPASQVRFRYSRFERLHEELLRELPGLPLPPLPQKRGPAPHVQGASTGAPQLATARHSSPQLATARQLCRCLLGLRRTRLAPGCAPHSAGTAVLPMGPRS